MSADKKPKISIDGKSNCIYISKEVIKLLGTPEYVCILVGADKRKIAITACQEKHVMSYKVPASYTERKLRVYSMGFTHALIQANHLDEEKTNVITGEYSEENNAVIFPVKLP
jgi:hypothetical protein